MAYISGGNELLDAEKNLKRLGVKTGMYVADLGCGGAGHFIIPAAKLVGGDGLAYAVDILKSVLQSVVSRARLGGISNIKTVWSNLEIPGATNIPAGSLDAALVINILFQSKQHDNILKEAVRLLKPGGKLLVIDWDKNNSSFGPPQLDRVPPQEVQSITDKLGPQLLEEFEAGSNHYGLTFQK